tara:strand:+ start:151 stop:1446 length:1296 start_codon:yes stop_codon:yes gene_type:complete
LFYSIFFAPYILLLKDKSISKDVKIFSFLLFLIPIALVTGPAAPDIILSIIALYFLIKSIFHKLWNYYHNLIVYGFLLFCLYGILRSLFSDIPIDSLTNEGSAFYFRYIFFAMGVWYLLNHNPYLSKCLLYIILICVFFVGVGAYLQYFLGFSLLGFEKNSAYRLTLGFTDEPHVGRYLAFLSMFAFALIYQSFKISKKILLFLITFLIFIEIIVFLSGERSAFFYFFFFSILILIYVPRFKLYRLIGFLISSIIIFLIINFNSAAKDRMINYTLDQISETKLPFLPYSEHHEQHYIVSFKMFKSNPIFGVGTNSFRFKCDKDIFYYKKNSCTTHSHNFYIQLLAELGLLGFFFISSFFGYFVYYGIKQLYFLIISKENKLIPFEHFLFLIINFVFLWPLITHMSFYNNWNTVFMMLPLGYSLRYLYNNKL